MIGLEGLRSIIGQWLANTRPEVFCISGPWGVGKTHAWRQLLKESNQAGDVSFESYAYVSLFGLNSLASLRQAIVANTVGKSDIGRDPSLDTLGRFLKSPRGPGLRELEGLTNDPGGKVKNWLLKSALVASNLGIVSRFLGDASAALFLSVQNRLICFDDVERRGKGLSIHDVLGLASMLKDQRRCKIVLLLNDEAMTDEEQKEFRTHLDKAVDIFFRFLPMPEESARIAFPSQTPLFETVSQNCIKLGLTNIRTLNRIRRFVEDIAPALELLDPSILHQAVSTVVMLCWVVYDTLNAPTIKYLEGRSGVAAHKFTERLSKPAQELEWDQLLQSYGFGHLTDLDRSLLQGIQHGVFDKKRIKEIASDMNSAAINRKGERAFRDAWSEYHGSFDDNQDVVVERIKNSYYENFKYVSPGSLNSLIELFKELGQSVPAAAILKHHTENRMEKRLFVIESQVFASEIRDPDVIVAFNKKELSSSPELNKSELLKMMAKSNQYDSKKLLAVAQLSTEELTSLLKGLRGTERDEVLFWCLSTGNIGTEDAETSVALSTISDRTSQALHSISAESPLNRQRIIRFQSPN